MMGCMNYEKPMVKGPPGGIRDRVLSTQEGNHQWRAGERYQSTNTGGVSGSIS